MNNKDLCQMVKQNGGKKARRDKLSLPISLSISASLSFYLCVSRPLVSLSPGALVVALWFLIMYVSLSLSDSLFCLAGVSLHLSLALSQILL